MATTTFRGVIHGTTIELNEAPALPDGQVVNVVVFPKDTDPASPPGEGLRQAFGAWADDGDDLDQFLEWVRLQRKLSRGYSIMP